MKPESLRNVTAPGMDDHLLEPEDFEEPGHLSTDGAKVTMKARMALGLCDLSCSGRYAAARGRSPLGPEPAANAFADACATYITLPIIALSRLSVMRLNTAMWCSMVTRTLLVILSKRSRPAAFT